LFVFLDTRYIKNCTELFLKYWN